MKLRHWLFCFLFLSTISMGFSQKRPTIMVVPSDVWCNTNGYMTTFNDQGSIKKIPDYKKALQENSDLLLVISKINSLMLDRGFKLADLETKLKDLEGESAVDAMSTSKNGAGISESPIDKLKKVAKADIIMQMTWTVNSIGPKKSITFILRGLDSYTDAQVAGAQGTGNSSFSAELPVLIEEAVLAHLDNFNTQLQSHFDDLFKNGREITLRIKKWDSFSGDLETKFDGEELKTKIEKWVSDNTVEHKFNLPDATENMMKFEQVRIPMRDSNNRSLDASGWARGLQKYLSDSFKIEAKLVTKGLGGVTLIVGEK